MVIVELNIRLELKICARNRDIKSCDVKKIKTVMKRLLFNIKKNDMDT